MLKPFNPPWLDVALKELGVAEVQGPKDNPRIVEYHQATTLKATDDEVPWCSSFACWCMQQSSVIHLHKATARSWLLWGVPLQKPAYGCVVVIKRGNNPAQGHVGFLVGIDAEHVHILGGNQGDKVSIAPFKREDVLGYRWY